MGLLRLTRRAMWANCLGLPNDSTYNRMTVVAQSLPNIAGGRSRRHQLCCDADEGRKPEVQSPRSGEQGQPKAPL